MILKANFHTHTNLCDGKNSPEEMINAALKLNFTHLGFSGHMDADIHMNIENYKNTIHALKEKYKNQIQVLCGIELDNLYDTKFSEGMDYVIGSTHFLDVKYSRPLSVDNTKEDLIFLCNEFFSGDYYKLAKAYYELEAEIFDKTHCNFVGHFDLLTKFNNELHFIDENNTHYKNYALDSLEYLANQNVIFEINTHNSKIMPAPFILKRLAELNGEIIINSDAHNVNQLNMKFNEAIELAKSCGFNHSNILELNENNICIKQIDL